MVKTALYCFGLFFKGLFLFAVLYIMLLMNVLTIPFFVISWAACKLFAGQIPHVSRYGLCFYPSWSSEPKEGLIDTFKKIDRETNERVRKKSRNRVRAWEERFF